MLSLSRRAVLAGVGVLMPALPAAAQLSGMSREYPGIPEALLGQWRERLLGLAHGYRGQTVGGGRSTEFVFEVFRRAGFPASESQLQWGRPWAGRMVPGIVMQMLDGARWEGPNGYFYTDRIHTLILSANTGGQRWQVIHQDWMQRQVGVNTLDFGWRQVRGRVQLWHPFG